MPTDSDAVSSTSCGVAKTENVALNFVLAGYVDPTALPGVVPTPKQACAAMAAMKKRAKFEAYLIGAAGSDAAEDGLGQALQELGHSRVAETYVENFKGTRHYVNRVIRRHVRKAAFAPKTEAAPAGDEPVSHEDGPELVVEARDLAKVCAERTRRLAVVDREPRPDESRAARDTRIHRQRKALWVAVSPLFPEFAFRPLAHRPA